MKHPAYHTGPGLCDLLHRFDAYTQTPVCQALQAQMHQLSDEERRWKKEMQEARVALKKGQRLVKAGQYASLSSCDKRYFVNFQSGQLKKWYGMAKQALRKTDGEDSSEFG